jgi:putative phosphoribosyl transferase
MIFKDRTEAGKLLLEEIVKRYDKTFKDPVVVAIPRGGVTVADPIAEGLNAPIELVIPRKIGAPFNEEFAVAAITEDGHLLMNPEVTEDVAYRMGITRKGIMQRAVEQIEEIKRRRKLYLKEREKLSLKNRDVILVDDGIATGLTVKAAIFSIRRRDPHKLILAVPIMPHDKLKEFEDILDGLVVLYAPENFGAVGQFYQNFNQVSDAEVIRIMEKHGLK